VGQERGPLSLLSTIEELLGRKSSGSGLESREYGRRDPSHWPRGTYPQKLAPTSPTSGGSSIGIVPRGLRPRSLVFFFMNVSHMPNPQAGGPLLVGCDRLFSLFAATGGRLHFSQPEDVPCRCDPVTSIIMRLLISCKSLTLGKEESHVLTFRKRHGVIPAARICCRQNFGCFRYDDIAAEKWKETFILAGNLSRILGRLSYMAFRGTKENQEKPRLGQTRTDWNSK
jgi:hypothetical protein